MKLQGGYDIAAPRARVFAALLDPAVLQKCIDGCESLTKKDEHTYEARLRVGIGSIKGVFTGQARMENVQPPESYTLAIDGRGTPGFVKGSGVMQLTGDSGTTHISCEADVTVGGVIAAVGSRLIEAVAKKMMDKFFENLRAEVTT